MLLVLFLCFNWHAGVSLTGPTVHFYVRHIKEREGEWRERGWRQTWGGVRELKWPCRPGALSAPAFIFHCHAAPFHPFLVWFLLSLFPCLHLPGIVFSPTRVCPRSCGYICLPLSFLSRFACFLRGFRSRNISAFLPFIYVLYIASHSFIHWFWGWRPFI